MGVAGKAGKPRPIMEGLRLVADFLNAIGPETTDSQWEAFLKTKGPLGPFFAVSTDVETRHSKTVPVVTLAEAKEIRWWINNDLGFLRIEKSLQMPFTALVYRLNELKLETGWQCFPWLGGKLQPGQAILTMHYGDGIKGRWTAQSWPITKSLKEYLYAMLGGALVSGALSKLKVCRECAKYLVVKNRRRGVCPNCKDDFYNHKRSETGYWKQRRDAIRSRQIERARALIKQRVSFQKTQEKTGLPARVIEKLQEA